MENKVKILETDNLTDILRVKNILRDSNIDYEAKTKGSTIIHNFMRLFIYRTMSFGLGRENEVTCFYVSAEDADRAASAIKGIGTF